MREATCKDCLREERGQQIGVAVGDLPEDFATEFVYNERAAEVKLERGQTRSDRCKRHRARHRINIQGMAVPYIDLQTIGEALGAHDDNGPSGPFGGLGPLPTAHRIAENTEYDLSKANVGMTDKDILEMLVKLEGKRVLIAKAGTGTGKSTFMPYRLLDPPEGASFNLSALGPIIVTEPRVQATTGVATYVGTVLSGAGGVGPGYPVGFQVSGTKAHDDSCQLVYVTDGTMINWLREGRLSTIGTVIVDEAHERSTNIDFIMGYLKEAVDRYPHLRVIVTSATFDEHFYQDYFGGPDKVDIHVVEAVKSIGYGFPLFPDLDAATPASADLTEEWRKAVGPDLPLRQVADPADDIFITKHFQPLAPPLGESDVAENYPDPATGVGWTEDLQITTTQLLPLRFQPASYAVPEEPFEVWRREWPKHAPRVLGEYIVDLVKGLDAADIYGDVLGFLPTTKNIEAAVDIIKSGLGIRGEHGQTGDAATVYPLISSLPTDIKEKALVAQVKGDQRKIVVSTNLAETSLTVEGVRFVVDSGLIAQDEWNPQTAQGGVRTNLHSQAGIRQRWGRVGRKAPGWAFPLYSKEQFLSLESDTAPGSTRSNLENLIMTAKLGGIDDVVTFDWPAKFWPAAWPQTANLDPSDDGIAGTTYESAARSRRVFLDELTRADSALRISGALDGYGDPTAFGKDLSRAPALGTEASKIALMHADRLACVPEVATILQLLGKPSMVRHDGLLLSAPDWPAEWQLEAAERHLALASGCSDDADLVLQVMAVWERCDPGGAPAWQPSPAREEWARRWWVNHELLVKAAEARHEVLVALSPAMKEDVKRFVEPALLKRARGAITRAFAPLEFRRGADGSYLSVDQDGLAAVSGVIDNSNLFPEVSDRIIPLKRNKQEGKDHAYLSSVVTLEEWALPDDSSDGHSAGPGGSLDLLLKASRAARPEVQRSTLAQLKALWPSGMRVRLNFVDRDNTLIVAGRPLDSVPPAKMPRVGAEELDKDESAGLAQDESPDLAEADANPGLDTSWPSPVDAEPDDLELGRELELSFLADHVDYLAACRECTACRSGYLQDCESPIAPKSPERITNELEQWVNLSWRNQNVAHPCVELIGTEASEGAWYEVVGYRVDESGPAIQMRAAWRQDDENHFPGLHDGLSDRASVQLEVGPVRSGHRGARYRTFFRNVQGRNVGRFALRVASDSEALARRTLVDGLVTTRMTGDTATLTFVPNDRRLGLRLDLPRLSLEEAAEKYPVSSFTQMVVTNVHDNGGSAWLEAPDGTEGRVTRTDVGASGVGDLRTSLAAGDEVQAIIREVKEHNGKVQLQVALPDVSTPTVEDARAFYPSGATAIMRVTGIAKDGDRAWLVTGDGFGAMALRKDAGTAGVADLRDVLAQGDELEARVLSVGEYNSMIQITVALPTLSGPTLAEAAQQQFAAGTRAQFTVTGILPDGRRAFLKSSSGVSATLTSDRVGNGGVLSLSTILAVGQTVDAIVVRVGEHRGEPQIELSMPELGVPSIERQLKSLRIIPGEVHDGVVSNVADFGIFVAVGPVSGLVHKSKLPGTSTAGFAKGRPLRVVVEKADEDPNKPGNAKIGLAPA
jgi:HrpA-like RNA helicase/predicted RNA-binding protein with RPS1 domain